MTLVPKTSGSIKPSPTPPPLRSLGQAAWPPGASVSSPIMYGLHPPPHWSVMGMEDVCVQQALKSGDWYDLSALLHSFLSGVTCY